MNTNSAGNLLAQITEKDKARFWAKVDARGPDECWLWIAGRNKAGYGTFRDSARKRPILAPRFSWQLHNGVIPEGMCVLHNCPSGDNPACVNPQHLWLGTKAQNSKDMADKGRSTKGDKNPSRLYPERVPRGDGHWKSILDADKVRKMRQMRSEGVRLLKIGEVFGVHIMTVHGIVHRNTWKHVE